MIYKDVKHKAWEILQTLIEEGQESFNSSPLRGSRYRVWILYRNEYNRRNDIKNNKQCLFQMLTTDNVDARVLTWYSTLPQVLPKRKSRECLNIVEIFLDGNCNEF